MAGLGIHAQGYVGIAFETTYGTYAAPTKFFPLKSESMVEAFENVKRRNIRGIADTLGIIAGYSKVEGSLEAELMEDVLPYFLYCSRNTVVKTGTSPNLIYTTTPAHYGASTSLPAGKKGLSITVVKNDEIFGFTGCIVSQMTFGVDTGTPTMKFDLIGRAEATATLPTPTWSATDVPFGAGQFSIELPTATQVFDVASYTLTINDNAEAQNRLMSNRYAQWVKFGQREVMMDVERDFSSRGDLDLFKALTTSSVSVVLTKNVNEKVTFKLANAIRDSLTIDGLSSQGNAVMTQIKYEGVYDSTTSKSYEIVVACQTDII